MRGRRGIAEQHDIAGRPALAQNAIEIEPGRAAQMLGVRHQRIAVRDMCAKIFSQARNASSPCHLVEAELAPGVFRAFDDEGRGIGIELIGVRPDPAVLGFLEDEGEGLVEFLLGAEPDIFAGAHVDVGLEHIGVRGAHARIDAVGADDQIVVLVGIEALRLGFEPQIDAERRARAPAKCSTAACGRCRKIRGRRSASPRRDNARRRHPNKRTRRGSPRR